MRTPHALALAPSVSGPCKMSAGHISLGNLTVNCVSANEYPIEYEDQLATINKPTLVITGEYDRTCTPRAAREMAAGIPGAELLIVPNAGHMTHVEQPEIVLPAIRAFFKRQPVA